MQQGIQVYLKDFWNTNDLLMIIISWFYCAFRLTIGHNGAFVIVKNLEFTESHLETELALDVLQNQNN